MGDDLIIIPAPRDSEGYAYLTRSRMGKLYRKHILNLGELKYEGRTYDLDDSWYARLKDNFNSGVCDIVQVPLANDANAHSEDPARNLGEVIDIQREGNKVYAVIDARKNADDFGKAQPLYAKVLTPDRGFVLMGDLRVGDRLVDPEGQPSEVIGVFPRGVMRVYEVRFADGTAVRCSGDHLWKVKTGGRAWSVRPLSSWLGRVADGRRVTTPVAGHLEFGKDRSFYIDPYLLGLLVGDGSFRGSTPTFSSADSQLHQSVRELLPLEVGMVLHDSPGRVESYYLSAGRERDVLTGRYQPDVNPLTCELKRLGLWGHDSRAKFIPGEYLTASLKQRVSLLQGLMDTDGYVNRNGCTLNFDTVSPQLAEDVTSLARSVGCTSWISPRLVSYRVTLRPPAGFELFRLERKLARQKIRAAVRGVAEKRVVSVREIGDEPVQCIAVSAPSRLYVTDGFNVTHNTLLGASAFLHMNYKNTTSQQRVGPALLHVAVTNRPYITKLEPYQEIIAASADGTGDVLVLASEEESAKMTREEMLAQLRDEHGIDVEALQAQAAQKTDAAQLTAAITEALKGTGTVALAGAEGLDADTLTGAIVELAGTARAQGEEIGKLRRQQAETEVDGYITAGRVLPKQRPAFVELALSNRDMLDQLLPGEPVVRLNHQDGAPTPDGEHSQERDIDGEVARLAAEHKELFEKSGHPGSVRR